MFPVYLGGPLSRLRGHRVGPGRLHVSGFGLVFSPIVLAAPQTRAFGPPADSPRATRNSSSSRTFDHWWNLLSSFFVGNVFDSSWHVLRSLYGRSLCSVSSPSRGEPKRSRTAEAEARISGDEVGSFRRMTKVRADTIQSYKLMFQACVIAHIFGGLGNQLFCYAAARRLSLINKVPLKLDMTSGFQRDRFGKYICLTGLASRRRKRARGSHMMTCTVRYDESCLFTSTGFCPSITAPTCLKSPRTSPTFAGL